MSHQNHRHSHDYLLEDELIARNEKKRTFVVVVTAGMMIFEVISGYLTGSMALLADGWHMASHAGALTISLVAYRLGRSGKLATKFSFGAGKIIPLAGYTSAIILALIASAMAVQCIERLLNPVPIRLNEAIWVAILGLVVNILCAAVLFEKEHHHENDSSHVHDHNFKSAYVHVLADAVTSVLAIVALLAGKFSGVMHFDPIMGIVGSFVILRWSYQLCKETVWELLDGHSKTITPNKVREYIESHKVEVADLHIWRIAPNAHACELVVFSEDKKGTEYYRSLLEKYNFGHLIVEERVCLH
ncbi:MAG: CDF family Co(II)/Ni(II) efflux transporter DmeF [Bacteriovoracia bacterium]